MGVRKPDSDKKTARRAKVAAAVATGKAVTHVASELGVSRATVHRDLHQADTRQIISDFIGAHFAAVEDLFVNVLRSIADALEADRTVATKDGGVVSLGADHYARLTAAKRYLEIVTAGRPTPKPPEAPTERKKLSPAEVEQMLQEYVAAEADGERN